MVGIRYKGSNPLPLFGKLMLPGEVRQVGERQWEQVQREYPGKFELITPSRDHTVIYAEPKEGADAGQSGNAGKPVAGRSTRPRRRAG